MGRTAFGTYGTAWVPPDYTVDDHGKVVGGYAPAEPHNWGRWGELDQRGTLNLIGPDEIAFATSRATAGKVFSLALPIDETAPNWPTRPAFQHFVTMSGSDVITGTPISASMPGYVYTDDVIHMAAQGSSQWDGLAHVAVDDVFYNGFWVGTMTSARGAEVLGIGNLRSSCVGRGVLLDMARHLGVDCVENGRVYSRQDLDAVAAAQAVELRKGDIVLIRSGSIGRWWQLEDPADKLAWFSGWAGVGVDTVGWFHEHDIAAGASDTVGFEVVPVQDPSRPPYPLHHRLLVDLGFPIGEMWELDQLAADCAEDGQYDFLLVAPPLALMRAAGSPLNPIAIK